MFAPEEYNHNPKKKKDGITNNMGVHVKENRKSLFYHSD